MSTPNAGAYLFLGLDRPRKLQRIQDLERQLKVQPLDRHQIDASLTSGAELLALCRQQPAVSPIRLIVVDEAHHLDHACVEALVCHQAAVVKNACLILLVEKELSVRHALARPPTWIKIEHFPLRDTVAVKPFALTDALGRRDVVQALAAAHDQMFAGKEPLELLGLVAWQLQRWVTVKRLLREGLSAERIASVTGMRSWQVQRLQAELSKRSLPSLQLLLKRCWQLDVDSKRARTLPHIAIEQLVLEVCA
jgi:DNA polymerase III delta subunit